MADFIDGSQFLVPLDMPATAPKPSTSYAGPVALVAVVGAIGAGLWYLFRPERHGARENPLLSTSTPTTRGKTVAYRVQLASPPHLESIQMLPDGTATFSRFMSPLAHFQPLPYQRPKIRSGRGVLLIFTDQLLR